MSRLSLIATDIISRDFIAFIFILSFLHDRDFHFFFSSHHFASSHFHISISSKAAAAIEASDFHDISSFIAEATIEGFCLLFTVGFREGLGQGFSSLM